MKKSARPLNVEETREILDILERLVKLTPLGAISNQLKIRIDGARYVMTDAIERNAA